MLKASQMLDAHPPIPIFRLRKTKPRTDTRTSSASPQMFHKRSQTPSGTIGEVAAGRSRERLPGSKSSRELLTSPQPGVSSGGSLTAAEPGGQDPAGPSQGGAPQAESEGGVRRGKAEGPQAAALRGRGSGRSARAGSGR